MFKRPCRSAANPLVYVDNPASPMATMASAIPAIFHGIASGAKNESSSAATARARAATYRVTPDHPLFASPPWSSPACPCSSSFPSAAPGSFLPTTGCGENPARRMASSAGCTAASSALIARVRAPSWKLSERTPAIGSSARRISLSSAEQSMVLMRHTVA